MDPQCSLLDSFVPMAMQGHLTVLIMRCIGQLSTVSSVYCLLAEVGVIDLLPMTSGADPSSEGRKEDSGRLPTSLPASSRRGSPSSAELPTVDAATITHNPTGSSAEAISSQLSLPLNPYPSSSRDHGLLIHEQIGKGGLSRVYRGWQRALERDVAVKIPRDDLRRPELAQQLMLEEARITARLQHPGIPSIHDLQWDAAGRPMLAMRRIEGELWSRRQGELTRRENAGVVMRVAQVIAYAHQQGVLHRDIKPGNVMIGDFGEVMLLDWGMALPLAEIDLRPERWSGGACGTPQFIAPEAALGQAPGVATDVYGLGALLWFAIYGQPPHLSEDPQEALRQAREDEVSGPGDPGTDDLLAVALRALSFEASRRYPTAVEFIAALEQAFSREDARRLILDAQQDMDVAAQEGYPAFQRALFRLQESRGIWPDNEQINQRINDVMGQYAGYALGQGDLDLAATVLREDCIEHRRLLAKLRYQRRRRELEQEEMRRHEARLFYEQRRTQFIQAFLLDVLSETALGRQGPKVRLIDALAASLQTLQQQLGSDPLHRAYVRQGVISTLRGKQFVDIRRPHVEALLTDIEEAKLDEDHELVRQGYFEKASLLRDEERFSEAVDYVTMSLRLCSEHQPEMSAELAYVYELYMECALGSRRIEEAGQIVEQVVIPMLRDQPMESPWRHHVEGFLFGYLVRIGSLAEAENVGRSLYLRADLEMADDLTDMLSTTMNLGYLMMDQGRWDEALEFMREARVLRIKIFGESSPQVLAIEGLLGTIHLGRDDLRAAECLVSILDRMRNTEELLPRDCFEPLLRVGRLRQRQGDLKAAGDIIAEAKAILPSCTPDSRAWLGPLTQLLESWCLRSQGEWLLGLMQARQACRDLEAQLGVGDGRCRRARVIMADHLIHWQRKDTAAAAQWCQQQQDDDFIARCSEDHRRFPGLVLA
ncbi:MAG: serine/threonine protein kinase [Planctomycetota bacterium]|nr:MAG: serine/threonine protein kinase [Planctomycetota bacterium]